MSTLPLSIHNINWDIGHSDLSGLIFWGSGVETAITNVHFLWTICYFFITSPHTNLPNLFSLLDHFGRISGLLGNCSKSEAMSVNIPNTMQRGLQAQYPFLLQTAALSYLGIKLIPQISSLYKANYPAMFHKLLENVRTWSDATLSWMGRIASVKMIVLSKI